MKSNIKTLLFAALLAAATPVVGQAQSFQSLTRRAVQGAVNQGVVNAKKSKADAEHEKWESKSRGNSSSSSSSSSSTTSSGHKIAQGKTYYVNCLTGSGRAPGTKESPYKDIQKAINNAVDGDIILVAEGNYLGSMDQGYLEIKKYITLQGGYSSDFSQWDPVRYKTYIQPNAECAGTNGNFGLMDLDVTGNDQGAVIIDGIGFDKGEENLYCAYNPKDAKSASPEGCLTGRMLKVGESPSSAKVGGADINKALMFGKVEGVFVVRNCTFVNGNNFALQVSCAGGRFEIYNNVFCANVMAAFESRGMKNDQNLCSVDFHHNTVLFTWTRDKEMGDMGQGFRFLPGYGKASVHDNIFGCNILGAVERTHYDSDKTKEANRFTSLKNNAYFMNHADLILPSGGGKWLYVKAKNMEDVDEKFLTEVEGNRELNDEKAFIDAIDPSYLKGYASLQVISSQSYDANSAANQVNRAFGLNQQGTETIRVSMFANKYPFLKAFDLYGAVSGRGAQTPRRE